jgi:hypothetical protein
MMQSLPNGRLSRGSLRMGIQDLLLNMRWGTHEETGCWRLPRNDEKKYTH